MGSLIGLTANLLIVLIFLGVAYWVIRLAVRHAIQDARIARQRESTRDGESQDPQPH